MIFTVASTVGSRYQWHNHVWLAQNRGVSEEEINAIARADRSTFPDRERVLISYARAIAYGQIEDPLHHAVSEFFDEGTNVGIVTLAAGYVAVGRVLEALGVDIEAGESSSDGRSADWGKGIEPGPLLEGTMRRRRQCSI